jgi:hypothetical protein
MLHVMSRQDRWRQNYRIRPYLEHSSEQQLAARLRYIIENMTTLQLDGKIGALTAEPHGKMWWELFTHVLEEYARRKASPPEGFLKDAGVPKVMHPIAEASIRAIRATSVPAEGTYLVKLGQREHMIEFYKRGRLRIAPASTYADPSLNTAIHDDELSLHTYGLQSEVLIEVFDPATRKRKGATRPIGNLTYTSRSKTNYYVYCMGLSLDYRLFGDFGYNACVIIRDYAAFEDRLSKAVAAHLPEWIGGGGPVHYVDPYNCTKDDIDVFFGKHHKFWYQREYRCAWIPSGQSISALQPFFVELGSMRDICQLVVLDIA